MFTVAGKTGNLIEQPSANNVPAAPDQCNVRRADGAATLFFSGTLALRVLHACDGTKSDRTCTVTVCSCRNLAALFNREGLLWRAFA
jgi:hypothetical protein